MYRECMSASRKTCCHVRPAAERRRRRRWRAGKQPSKPGQASASAASQPAKQYVSTCMQYGDRTNFLLEKGGGRTLPLRRVCRCYCCYRMPLTTHFAPAPLVGQFTNRSRLFSQSSTLTIPLCSCSGFFCLVFLYLASVSVFSYPYLSLSGMPSPSLC